MALSRSVMEWQISTMPERFADRLPEQALESITSFRNAGEPKFLVDWLMASLVKRQITISTRERDELREILPMLRLSVAELDQVPVTPSLPREQFEEQASRLVERFRDRVLEDDREILTYVRDHQMWRELVMYTVESLHEAHSPVTSQERDDLWLLLDALDLSRQELAQLPVT